MEARPPELIERAVRLLVPAPAREHVLGDLAERYESPRQYLGEALRTLPFVLVSQIRRTSNIAAWPIVAVLMLVGFGAGNGLAPAAVATGVTLLGYMLRDAYRVLDLRHPWRQGLVDTIVVVAFLVASQVVLAFLQPGWMLSPARAASGGVMLGLLYLLRAQGHGTPATQLWLAPRAAMSLEELRTEVRQYSQQTRRSMAIEVGVGLLIAPVFTATAVFGHPGTRAGALVAALGVVFVVLFIRRHMRWQPPLALGFADTLAEYRARLERSVVLMRNVWWWYLLPLGVGPLMMMLAGATTGARPLQQFAPMFGVFAVLWLSIALVSRRAAQGLRRRIDALSVLEERR
jgi:hypothetical protein